MATGDSRTAGGADTLVLSMSGDAWEGNPRADVSVNGALVAAGVEVTAARARDDTQAFVFRGDWGPNPEVAVSFTNDAYGGSPERDRGLYVDGMVYDGAENLGLKDALGWNRTLVYRPSSAPAAPIRAAAFVEGLGVNIHPTYWDTSYGLGGGAWGFDLERVMAALDRLGIRSVRADVPDARTLEHYRAMGERGVRFDLLVPGGEVDLASTVEAIAAVAPYARSIEAPNEVNLWPVSYRGLGGLKAATALQADLYAAVKADPRLRHIPVVGITLGGVGEEAHRALGDLSAHADLGNAHVYFSGGLPPGEVLDYALGVARIPSGADPVAVTETGYPTWEGGVGEDAQARYTLDLAMDAAARGVEGLYFYELLDEWHNPADPESNFGLFRADGSPKPAAEALGNLVSILSDPSPAAASFPLEGLPYTLRGQPASADALLLQKGDGSHQVVVWAEPPLWRDGGPVEATPRPVSLEFGGRVASVRIFDPLEGTAPIASHAGVRSVSFDLSDHPVVAEVVRSLPGRGAVRVTDAAGARYATASLAAGERAYEGALTGLARPFTQSVGPDGVNTVSTPVWGADRVVNVRDAAGGSYATNGFLEANLSLGGATGGKVLLTHAKRGVLSFGGGSYTLVVDAFSDGPDKPGQDLNRFVVSAGEARVAARVNGRGASTNATFLGGSADSSFEFRGAGSATFEAGSGNATLSGGSGHNAYVYREGSGRALVSDSGETELRIDLGLRPSLRVERTARDTVLDFGAGREIVLVSDPGFSVDDIRWS